MEQICCENCLDEFEADLDSDEPVICPFCRQYTRIDFNDLEILERG